MKKGWIVYWSLLGAAIFMATLLWAPTASIEAVGKVIAALSPIVTVALAIFGLFVWRLQLVAKRRFELAEEGLAAAIAVSLAYEAVRNPLRFSTEGSSRTKEEGEQSGTSKLLDEEFVPIERITRFNEEFTTLEKKAIVLEPHFGKEVTKHMWDLLRVRNRIVAAVHTLHGMGPLRELDEGNRNTYHMLNAVIVSSRTTGNKNPALDDVVTGEIEQLITKLKEALRPYLDEPTMTNVFRLGAQPPPKD
jgi:hypothetical protein